MASEWIETVLQEIAVNEDRAFAMGPFGSNIKSENYRESGVPVIRGTNLGERGEAPFIADDFVFLDEEKADNLASSNCSPNDIVFVAQGTVGKVGIVPSDTSYRRFVLSQNLMKVTVDLKRADPRFVFYFYRSSVGQHEIMSRVNPTGVPCISKPLTSLRQFSIRLPSDVNEQRAIAHILGTLDDKIDMNRRMNETLEAMARALFKSWFVDFNPVRAKMEGRDPGLPKHIADLFPARLIDSELGEIPEGWGIGCVNDEFELTMGQSPPGETYNEVGEGLPFYQGRADFGFRFPTRRVYCTAPTRMARSGETFISVRAPVGDINMASEQCAIGRGVAAARHKTGSRSYSYQFMRGLKDVFARFEAEGTVFGSIGKKDFHAIPCVMPPRELIVAFEMMLSPVDSRIELCERESRTLAALRDTLLPKLISGELRIRNAKSFIEKVR